MNKINTDKGTTVFYLDRNSHNASNVDVSIVEMVIEENNGQLVAVGKAGYFTIRFGICEIETINKRKPTVFSTREEAIAQHAEERQAGVNWVLNMTKEELIRELFSVWSNPENEDDARVLKAMKEKIKTELGVNL